MKISVCIATFNGERYIKEQLNSILVQLGENDEIIISDDSSTDGTVDIIKSFADSRIKIFENQHFHNVIFNIEHSLKQATGKYIFLADQDDVWLPQKVSETLEYLTLYDLVISDLQVVDGDLVPMNEQSTKIPNLNPLKVIIKNPYIGCCMAFNRNVLNNTLPFPKYIPMHDMWIGVIASLYFKPYFLNKKLIYYRRHGSNLSYTGETSQYPFIKKISFRLNLLKAIVYAHFKKRV
ncbi:glycosyltransferase family 2 protein [Flectobacillus major]|uniref:glycosyltransferase family 2 protein n=1 Tax=Flectobacillus major TaxID=103 RepID=UPI0003F913E1|nr:glycosyltransferase family 2 protein [Flectobacillus major]